MTEAATAAPSGPLSADQLIEHYYAQGYTDGLPVVPPTRALVDAMLAGGGLKPDQIVAMMPGRHTPFIAEKLAINAVMAGCRPEYMPVVVAAVKALAEPLFNGHGPVTTTGSTALVTLVNGPIARRLEINGKDNAFGPGFRANSTIGRALRLILMNVLNCRPGRLDRSQLGNPGRYSFCFAENEEDSPWEPFHVTRGFSPHQSALTLFAAQGQVTTNNALTKDPEKICFTIADAMAYLGSHNILGHGDIMVVFGREVTNNFAAAGWSRRQVQDVLFEHARRSAAELKRAGRLLGDPEPGDAERWFRVVTKPEDIMVIAAGGPVGSHAAVLHTWGLHNPTRSVTVPITEP